MALGARGAALVPLLSLLAAPAAAAPAPVYSFEFVAYPGADTTILHGVRGDGVAVGEFTVLDPNAPFPGPLGQPAAVLDRGFFELSAGAFAEFEIPGLADPFLQGVNDGGVIWGYSGDSGEEAFVLGPGGVALVDHPDYDNAYVSGVDGSGLVYGTRSNDDPDDDPEDPIQFAIDAGPFVFDGVSFQDLAVPGASDPAVLGVRADGLVFGLDSDLGAFLFDGASVSIVDPPGDEQFTLLAGVSADGLVLGSQFTDQASYFLFDGVDYHPFAIPGASFGFAQGMNADGVIWGQSDLGAFVATPLPEPTTAVFLAVGIALTGLLGRGRRDPGRNG